jgi:hypothetical protein
MMQAITRYTSKGTIRSTIDCYNPVAAEVWKRRLNRSRMHFGVPTLDLVLSTRGRHVIATYRPGIVPRIFDSMLEYAASSEADN